MICTRSERTEFSVDEETLAQTQETFIHEAEIKNKDNQQVAEVTISNTEGEIKEQYTLSNGDRIN